jgi:hypothetical protein
MNDETQVGANHDGFHLGEPFMRELPDAVGRMQRPSVRVGRMRRCQGLTDGVIDLRMQPQGFPGFTPLPPQFGICPPHRTTLRGRLQGRTAHGTHGLQARRDILQLEHRLPELQPQVPLPGRLGLSFAQDALKRDLVALHLVPYL